MNEMLSDYGGLVERGTDLWFKLNCIANMLGSEYDLASMDAKVRELQDRAARKSNEKWMGYYSIATLFNECDYDRQLAALLFEVGKGYRDGDVKYAIIAKERVKEYLNTKKSEG